MLREFLAACARGRGAVLSVSGEIVMTNARAAHLLGPADQALLSARVSELLATSGTGVFDVCLSGGQWARVRLTPVLCTGSAAGAVLEVAVRDVPAHRAVPPAKPAVMLPGLAGRSPSWLSICGEVRELARHRATALLVGEPGVGKLALAKAVHEDAHPEARLVVVDVGRDTGLREALGDPTSTVVLRHLERLDKEARERLARQLADLPASGPRPWVVGTLDSAAGEESTTESLLAHFATAITVPPLRHHSDDLQYLVPALLQRLAPGRQAECDPDVLRTLARHPWPGNVAQLERVLRTALSRRRAGNVRLEDLPAECFATSRRRLTQLESVERDAIVKALIEAGGNRVKAAANLGIGRATLYRKISAYGIEYEGRNR
jgi:transcriptional regulator with AAA-type ATPase domain